MTNPTLTVVRQVWDRDESRCFACSLALVHGQGGYSIHHRRARGMGGSRRPETNLPGNLLLLCGSGTSGCHGLIEKQRQYSLDLGLLVSQHQEPVQVPVLRWRTTLVFLDNEGTFRPAKAV